MQKEPLTYWTLLYIITNKFIYFNFSSLILIKKKMDINIFLQTQNIKYKNLINNLIFIILYTNFILLNIKIYKNYYHNFFNEYLY